MISFNNYTVHKFDDSFILDNKLIKHGVDDSGWRIFYHNEISNWIVCYPYCEFHGGGQPYIIKINSTDFEKWIYDNLDFEIKIRQLIEND